MYTNFCEMIKRIQDYILDKIRARRDVESRRCKMVDLTGKVRDMFLRK